MTEDEESKTTGRDQCDGKPSLSPATVKRDSPDIDHKTGDVAMQTNRAHEDNEKVDLETKQQFAYDQLKSDTQLESAQETSRQVSAVNVASLEETLSNLPPTQQQQQQQQTKHQHQPRRRDSQDKYRKHQHQNQQTIELAQSNILPNVPVSADYLAQLIKDKKQLAAFPTAVFFHLPRLIDEEISKVRQSLFQLNDVVQLQEPLVLPEPEGDFVALQEKIYVPIEQHPEYNFVGRLLGPRGMTAKQLEQETGCKIMIRGKGSMRDKKKEEQNRGKTNWEHLNDDLHVLITVEDTQNRAKLKLKRAIDEVRQLLVPVVDGEDELKKRQLMELAIINGTYRDCNYNEALNKMLSDVVYRQQQTSDSSSAQTASTAGGQQHSIAAANALTNGSPQHHQHHHNHQQQHQQQMARHFMSPNHHQYEGQQTPVSTSASNLNGSSISSGVASTGSSTPNSGQLPTIQHHGQHHHPHAMQQAHHHAAIVAAATAAAAAAQQQQHNGPPAPGAPSLPQSLQHHLHAHHHHPSSSAAAAAAAAAAASLMGTNPADTSALMYAQQYHDFQHYAAMVAAASAASQQQQLGLPPDYTTAHHGPPPPPHPHSHAHHQHAVAQAVAAAAAAAAAANQTHHLQYHRPPPPPSTQQQADLGAYVIGREQLDGQTNMESIEQSTNVPRSAHQKEETRLGKLTVPLNQQLDVRAHPYARKPDKSA